MALTLFALTTPFAFASDLGGNVSLDNNHATNGTPVKISYHPHNSSELYKISAKDLFSGFEPKSTRRTNIAGVVKKEDISSVKLPSGYKLSSKSLSEYATGHYVFYALNLSGKGKVLASGDLENKTPEKIEFLTPDKSAPSTIGFNGQDYIPETSTEKGSEKTCYVCRVEDDYPKLCGRGNGTILFAYVPKEPGYKKCLVCDGRPDWPNY